MEKFIKLFVVSLMLLGLGFGLWVTFSSAGADFLNKNQYLAFVYLGVWFFIILLSKKYKSLQ
ncbi:hypothetical protein [Hydrogenovibrio marinus]|uniref:Uncharacterized protein n=1 Tax=Hydrogenovibrio marinus TaxID=28885 RepID=A0A066ZQR9_HYDMR|nr:hypothetical protein [Hydrogenovibrio marinus]KDN94609.1 hypothetical protein EI16_11945 [Hydrogenovibrio marinus]